MTSSKCYIVNQYFESYIYKERMISTFLHLLIDHPSLLIGHNNYVFQHYFIKKKKKESAAKVRLKTLPSDCLRIKENLLW